jgi:circadian clock protein KaiC
VIPVITTGVGNLDEILGGGIPRRAMLLILGVPGAGKTILAEQIAIHQAKHGERVVVFTALSESNEQMLTTLREFSFFDESLVGDRVRFINIQTILRDGLEATADAIVEVVRTEEATIVVLDGFRGVAGFASTDRDVRLFLYEVRTRLAFLNATTLVTLETDMVGSNDSGALTVADGILAMHNTLSGVRHRRHVEVQKLRGMNHLDGLHALTITTDGITCYPRHEAVYRTIDYPYMPDRVHFGLPELDAMLSGGLNRGTGTLIAGSPGTGKTLLSLRYLMEGARRGEAGLYVGFHESAEQLYAKAEQFDLDLRGAVEQGLVVLECMAPVEMELDILAATIRERVERMRVRRFVIDPVAEIEQAVLEPGRAIGFFASLLNYLRERNVTTVITREISPFPEPRLTFTETPVSVLTENLLVLRSVEYQDRLYRIISVFKMRFSGFDPALREFRIEDGGIRVLPINESGEQVMTGITRQERRRSERTGGTR